MDRQASQSAPSFDGQQQKGTNMNATTKKLVQAYARQVRARRELGDSRPQYHSREPKIEAYKQLIDGGLSPAGAIHTFRMALNAIDAEVGAWELEAAIDAIADAIIG
jgi:hypothetical protein